MASRATAAAALGLLTLAGCSAVGESRFNPLNWNLGGTEPQAAPAVVERTDPRPLIGQLTEFRVERTAGGAVIRATGLAPSQGWHSAALVPVPAGPGILAYRFVAEPPSGRPTPVGPPATRTLTAADWQSDTALRGVRQILVTGATGTLAAR